MNARTFVLVSGIAMLLCSVGFVSAVEVIPSNQGQRRKIDFSLLQKGFDSPDRIYAPFIFWFWDEPLEPGKMAEMSRVMTSQGFNPGYAHARNSMVGSPDLPDDEWLGDKWFDSFGSALAEAEKQNSYLGFCDEYWWPSFQAHGRVLKQHPELKAESLKWQIIDAAGAAEVKVPASFFAVAARIDGSSNAQSPIIQSKSLRVIGGGEAFSWVVPAAGNWRVYVFSKYFQSGVDGGAVNAIDERLAPTFIEIALEPYAKRLGDKLGKGIPGVFRDHEGDYGRKLAWSDSLDRRFKERHGRDIRLSLPLMVDRDVEGQYVKARWEWFDLVSDLYAANFQAVQDWNARHGMYTISNLWEESLSLQVNAVGDFMKLQRVHSMPGQDCLGRKALQVHDFKETASVAEFQNTRAMTELMGAGIFGAAGNGSGKDQPWGTFDPVFLKQAVNAVTAWGMSHVVPHGVFTTRKLTGNPWPPDWYAESPMFPYMHLWTDFTRRASYINSMGAAAPDVLLFNPLESAWVLTDAGMLDEKVWDILEGRHDGSRIHVINKVYSDAINDLTDARIEFLVGDRFYLKQMEVKDGALVRGGFTFRTLVLPPLEVLTLESARKMVDFATAGGRVVALGELPVASADHGMNDPKMAELMATLKGTPTFTKVPDGLHSAIERGTPGIESPVKFLSGGFKMLQQRRRVDGRDFFWLVNSNEQEQNCEIRITGTKGAVAIWDCETGGVRPVTSVDAENGARIKLNFRPLEAYWLVVDPTAPAQTLADPPLSARMMVIEGPWKVSYDARIQPTMEFPSAPPPEFVGGLEKSLEDWQKWGCVKFSGLLDYTKTIEVETVELQGMQLDLGKVCHAAEVWVNGVSVGARLWGPHVFDVGQALRSGKNEIHVRVANLINNSYDDPRESGLLGPVILRMNVAK
jgi:hypothetical protein